MNSRNETNVIRKFEQQDDDEFEVLTLKRNVG